MGSDRRLGGQSLGGKAVQQAPPRQEAGTAGYDRGSSGMGCCALLLGGGLMRMKAGVARFRLAWGMGYPVNGLPATAMAAVIF